MIYKAIRVAIKALLADFWGTSARRAAAERAHWDERIADVLACPDNGRLHRVANAGQIVDGYQVMHNGLKVVVNGYYGDGITRMLTANGGCHEPQEEVVFDAIVRTLPERAIMVEAGAYWGFYSMWFSQAVQDARVFLVEPSAENLAVGQLNFRANGLGGDFTQAYVGDQPGIDVDGTRVVSIQSFIAEKSLTRLNVLHVDVQGCELQTLEGSRSLFDGHLIDYVFISTHSADLHDKCSAFLVARGYRLLASVTPAHSYSFDGVLVACSSQVTPPLISSLSEKPNPGLRSLA